MDGPRDRHTEWSKSDRERETPYDIAYMPNLKKKKIIQMDLFTKQCHRLSKFMVSIGEEWGVGIVRELGIDMYTLLYVKQITNKDFLYSTGNSAQYSIIT